MSLINEMLRNIDRRQTPDDAAAVELGSAGVQGVPLPERKPVLRWGLLGVGAVAIGVLAYRLLGWGSPVLVPAPVQMAEPVLSTLAEPVSRTQAPTPTAEIAAKKPTQTPRSHRSKKDEDAVVQEPAIAPSPRQTAVPGQVQRAPSQEQVAADAQRQALNQALASARAALQMRRADKALDVLEPVRSLAGEDAQYHGLLATALQQQSRHAEAVEHYLVALRKNPEAVNWLVGVGISLEATHQLLAAAEAYQKALDLGGSPALESFARDRLNRLGR